MLSPHVSPPFTHSLIQTFIKNVLYIRLPPDSSITTMLKSKFIIFGSQTSSSSFCVPILENIPNTQTRKLEGIPESFSFLSHTLTVSRTPTPPPIHPSHPWERELSKAQN